MTHDTPSQRRTGIGGALLHFALARLADRADRVQSLVDVENRPSWALHKPAGFRDTARRFVTWRRHPGRVAA
jgi:ribosomal protein S18 acetylase RimI-like enzyme